MLINLSKVILLDRDGVLNVDLPTGVIRPSDLELIPEAISAIARISRAGWRVAVCTNQANVGRGLLNSEDLTTMHSIINQAVINLGGKINAWFVCPHRPDDGCKCRKPAPGLLLDACNSFGVNPNTVVPFVGDSVSDVEAAYAAGCHPVLVQTGKGLAASARCPLVPVYQDLSNAIDAILSGAL